MNLLRYQRSNALLYFEAGAAIQKPERKHRFNTDSTTFNEKKGGNRLPFRGRTGKPPHSFLAPGSCQPVFPQELSRFP